MEELDLQDSSLNILDLVMILKLNLSLSRRMETLSAIQKSSADHLFVVIKVG